MLKPISRESLPRALEKAERYRLLNEPFLAESICLDVLLVEPTNSRALIVFVLALTDQFSSAEGAVQRAQATVAQMSSEYDRLYYSGIIAERRAITTLAKRGFQAATVAWNSIKQAMAFYEKAMAVQQDDANDDAVLRWNTCVRLLEAHKLTQPVPELRSLVLDD